MTGLFASNLFDGRGGLGAAGSRSRGLMGLGATPSGPVEQAPVQIGELAQKDPILSTASVIASSIMLRMASVPKGQRIAEMVSILNAGRPGLGNSARQNYLVRAASAAPDQKDQAMFDAIRAAIADTLVEKTLAMRGATSGLGQTAAEARGQTSQGVNDANAIFCSYISGTVGMVGGFVDQLAEGGNQNTGAITRSAASGATTAGCGAGRLVVQGDIALANARLAQTGTQQLMAAAAAREATFMRYALIGGGLIGALGLGYVLIKK